MFKRKPRPNRRSFRPSAEGLETRRVLSSYSSIPSASVSGTDIDGDRWTLTLYGPGTLNVVDKDGVAFTEENADVPNLINTITVAGTMSSQSRLVGSVTPASGSDGKVFFQNMNIQANAAYSPLDANRGDFNTFSLQNGIGLVDAPDFWLGNTSGAKPEMASPYHTGFRLAGSIVAPQGVNVLKFGGVDVNYTPPDGTPLTETGQNNEFVVNLGLPVTTGTSIIVDTVTTDAGITQGSDSTPPSVNQQSASFLVTGRLNLFQANAIGGNVDPGMAPTQFDPSAETPVAGGTYVVSQTGSVTGQIGYVRVGGDATNFTTMALGADIFTGSADVNGPAAGVTNFMVGGETDNVMLIAPGGSRDVMFGQGMDNVVISTNYISHLHANRGAVGSTVTASRTIDNMVMGGDVINSLIQSGYLQTINNNAVSPGSVFSAGGGAFNGVAPSSIIDRRPNSFTAGDIPQAHGGGGINAHIAGNVIDTIVSVSVDPDPASILPPGQFETISARRFPFGAPQNLVLPRGIINAKIEGEIDNSGLQFGPSPLVSPDVPSDSAFFAKRVHLTQGAVFPPKVDTAPFDRPLRYSKAQDALKGSFRARGIRPDAEPPQARPRGTGPAS